MLEIINAKEARELVAVAVPDREIAVADTLSADAMKWAIHNTIGRTDQRIRTYARFGYTHLSVKFAPGETDCAGDGNSFYNDLVANSNTHVADAISDIIYGRPQNKISPLQTARLLNAYSTQLARFVRDLEQLGYDVRVGKAGDRVFDDSTIIVSWE